MPIFIVLILTGTAMGFYNFCVTGNALRLPYQVHEETFMPSHRFLSGKICVLSPLISIEMFTIFMPTIFPYTSPNIRCPDFLRKTSASFGSR